MKSNRIGVLTFCAVMGSIAFNGVMYLGRYYGYVVKMTPNDLNLIKVILIVALLLLAQGKKLQSSATRVMVSK